MNPKKKTAQPISPTSHRAELARLLQDRQRCVDAVGRAQDQIDALQKAASDAAEAGVIVNGKITMFMRERGLQSVRCAGLLITDGGDHISVVPDHYTDLSA